MISKLQYVEFLTSIIGNYTGTHLAEHLDQTSHDAITDFLQSERLTAHHLWKLVHGLLADSPDAFLLADGIVQDKRYSRIIELVHRQYRCKVQHETSQCVELLFDAAVLAQLVALSRDRMTVTQI